MRALLIISLVIQTLFAAMPFNLERLDNLRVYFVNSTEYIDKTKEADVKALVEARLKKGGFTLNARDPRTFFVKIESMKGSLETFVYLQIGIGEGVSAPRDGEVPTFAITYHFTDFISTEAPYEDTKESLNFLIDQFIEQYREDNES